KIFWGSITKIITDGFSSEGLNQLEIYGELFIRRKLIFKRFSQAEQFGCAEGGSTHVIATILSGTETPSDFFSENISDFKREVKLGAYQAKIDEVMFLEEK
ncbi:MAG: hypothetical protein K2K81_04680, partial [Muribaculaceae bacterium]|nr:hypothetical protein [Muribaculaceae bacterium]